MAIIKRWQHNYMPRSAEKIMDEETGDFIQIDNSAKTITTKKGVYSIDKMYWFGSDIKVIYFKKFKLMIYYIKDNSTKYIGHSVQIIG